MDMDGPVVARVIRDTECNPTVLKYDLLRGVARVVRDPEVYITVSKSEHRRVLVQWLACFVWDEEAGGPSPLTPTSF